MSVLPGKNGGPEEPWYTPGAIETLEEELKSDFIAYEWGSGASTIWIAQRVKKLYTMENNEEWQDKVKIRAEELGITNIEQSMGTHPGEYTTHINEFPDEHFDIVFVDGRQRILCVKNAMPKVKRGGMLLLDNSQRKRYTGALWLMRPWEERVNLEGKWGTTIWTKP